MSFLSRLLTIALSCAFLEPNVFAAILTINDTHVKISAIEGPLSEVHYDPRSGIFLTIEDRSCPGRTQELVYDFNNFLNLHKKSSSYIGHSFGKDSNPFRAMIHLRAADVAQHVNGFKVLEHLGIFFNGKVGLGLNVKQMWILATAVQCISGFQIVPSTFDKMDDTLRGGSSLNSSVQVMATLKIGHLDQSSLTFSEKILLAKRHALFLHYAQSKSIFPESSEMLHHTELEAFIEKVIREIPSSEPKTLGQAHFAKILIYAVNEEDREEIFKSLDFLNRNNLDLVLSEEEEENQTWFLSTCAFTLNKFLMNAKENGSDATLVKNTFTRFISHLNEEQKERLRELYEDLYQDEAPGYALPELDQFLGLNRS